MLDAPGPLLSVTIPTRGRAARLLACVESVLACTGLTFEVIVVDQSDDSASEQALRPLRGDPRLRYCRSETRGVCAGRNQGIGLSRGEILVCTDDDCVVPPDWLSTLARFFAHDPDLSILFGRVEAHEQVAASRGFIATFDAAEPVLTLASLRRSGCGISANMSMRARVAKELEGFDEALGAGGVLGSAGETDFTWRALRRNHRVRAEPSCRLKHLGARHDTAASDLVFRYYFGVGAAYAKHARAGDAPALGVLFAYSNRCLVGMMASVLRGRPSGLKTFVSIWRGAAASFRYEVDPRRRLFVERGSKERVRGESGGPVPTGIPSRAL